MITIMAIVKKWRGKTCLAFLFRVSLFKKIIEIPIFFQFKQIVNRLKKFLDLFKRIVNRLKSRI